MTLAYPTELTIEQYDLFQSLLPAAQSGRPRAVDLMLVVQAILYVLVSGCAWRLLPREYPPSLFHGLLLLSQLVD
jgi:putative transposase